MGLECGKLPSTSSSFLLLRLIEQFRNQEQLIIAYDFDDTVKPYHCSNCSDVESVLRQSKDILNPYFIVFTSNSNYDEIKKYLDKYDIPYDAINTNAPFVPFKSGKIFYNVLLDDKAGLGHVVETLETLNYLVQNNKI